MDYFDNNMEHIKKQRAFMYKMMINRNICESSNRLEDIYSIDTRNGEKAVVIQFQSTVYRLNSAYNPAEEAKRWVDQYNFTNINSIVSMYGFGNGVFAREILQRLGEQDLLLIYEPSADIFNFVLHQYDLSDILLSDKVVIGVEKINEFEFHNMLFASLGMNNINNQFRLVYPQYDKIFPESCILFWNELKEAHLHAVTNINTERVFGVRMIENILNNLKFIRNSNTIADMEKIVPKDIPAIVVAAGPSVANQLDALKKAKGKAVIIAVDRIVDYLLDNGVEPDFIATLDAMKDVKYFTRRDNLSIPLLCFMYSSSEIMNIHQGRKIICNCTDYLVDLYQEHNHIPPQVNSSTSVATFAFTVCMKMGFQRIVLVGQDLAYEGNSTHAGGVEEKVIPWTETMVEGIHGDRVRSRIDWKNLIVWYEDMLTIFDGLEVIDAKDNGAKIKGTTVMSLQEALDRYSKPEDKFQLDIEQVQPTFYKDDWKNIEHFFSGNLELLDEIISKSNEAKKIFEMLISESKKSLHSKRMEIELNKIKKINLFIEKQPIYKLMDYYIKAKATAQLSSIYKKESNEKDDNIQTFKSSMEIYNSVVEAAEFIKPKLKQIVEKYINT